MQSDENTISVGASFADSSIGRANFVSTASGIEAASSPLDYQKILASKEMVQDALIGSLIGVSATLVIVVGVLVYLIVWVHKQKQSHSNQRYETGTRFSYDISPSSRDSIIPDDFLPGQLTPFTPPATDLLLPLPVDLSKEKLVRNGSLIYKNPYNLQRLGGQAPTADLVDTPRTFTRTTSWLMNRLSATNLPHVVTTPRRPKLRHSDIQANSQFEPNEITPVIMHHSPLPPWTKLRPNSIVISKGVEEGQGAREPT